MVAVEQRDPTTSGHSKRVALLTVGLMEKVDQIQVGDIREAKGHELWVKVFAQEWVRNDHTFESRDKVYFVGMVTAIALLVVAVAEMQFARRRAGLRPAGLIEFAVGVGAVVAGIAALHATDTYTGNALGAALIAVGTLVGLHGYGSWRGGDCCH